MKLERIDGATVRIPKTGNMRVEGRLFADGRILEGVMGDPCLEQIANVASLPGIVGASLAMPDIHWGYGFPIGGVAAFDVEEGVVSPGGVGYDINCGVRLLRTGLTREEATPRIRDLVNALFRSIPSGVGSSRSDLKLDREEMRQVSHRGAAWAVEQGFGEADDLIFSEDQGCLPGADFERVSARCIERGRDQLGTLGSGNHFVEVGYVDQVLRPHEAEVLGLEMGQIVVSIHTGSRGFGYQVCTEALEMLHGQSGPERIKVADPQLVCAPVKSDAGRNYLAVMACAANFAFANRQIISHFVRQAIASVWGQSPESLKIETVYDVAHNIAKLETHEMGQGPRKVSRQLCVHRKGATRSLPPGHVLVPERYRTVGSPVLIPGDMGRMSYVCVGTKAALEKSFGSCAHGAGRVMSRNEAIKASKGRSITDELARQGIVVRAAGPGTLKEELPQAYKDVSDVIRVVEKAGLAAPVVRLRPLGVVKG